MNVKERTYAHLSGKEFQGIVFSIFKSEILQGVELSKDFDDVKLCKDSWDKGKDLELLFFKNVIGTIQCKNSQKQLPEAYFLEEFVKFLMYGLNDNIFGFNNHYYYFVATKGFKNSEKYNGKNFEISDKELIKAIKSNVRDNRGQLHISGKSSTKMA